MHQRYVAQREGQAGGDLGRRWGSVSWRPPVDDVSDVHALAIQLDRGEHPVEELAGAADEWAADAVLIGTGALADDHYGSRRIAVGKNRVGRGALQAAAIEAGD